MTTHHHHHHHHHHSLPRSQKLAYATPMFTSQATGMVQSVFLTKYYNDVFGVPLTTLSIIIFVTSILSLYFSVFVGVLGDHYVSRWGRRRPFIAVLGPIKELAFFLLLVPLHSGAEGAHIVWFSVFYVVYNMCDEGASISRAALGTELTQDNEDRSSLYTWQGTFGLLGIFFAAGASSALNSVMSQRTAYAVMGVAFAAVGLSGFVVLLTVVKENTGYRRAAIPLVPGLNRCMRNRVWVQYMKSVSFLGAFNEITGLYAYVVQFVFHKNPDQFISVIIVEYAFLQLLIMPVVYRTIQTKGKLWVYRFGFVALVVHGCVFFLATFSNLYVFMLSVVFLSVGIGCVNVTANILLSDCIDYDELLSGKRRESTYQSVSNIPQEFFSVGGRALPLIFLNIAGYTPINWKDRDTKHEPDAVIWVLRLTLSVMPVALSCAAFYLFRNYPIDEQMHAKVIDAVTLMHEKSYMRTDYGLSSDTNVAAGGGGGGDDESLIDSVHHQANNEALARCVIDPVTQIAVPVPYFSQPGASQLQPSSSGDENDDDDVDSGETRDLLRTPLAPPPPPAAIAPGVMAPNDEFLLDHFTSRELCLLTHWSVHVLVTELRASSVFWFLVMAGTLTEGFYMAAAKHMAYSAFCWLFVGACASALWLVEMVRSQAARRLSEIPDSIRQEVVREHRFNVSKFTANAGDAGVTDVIAREDTAWHTSLYARYGRYMILRGVALIIVILGVLRIMYGSKETG